MNVVSYQPGARFARDELLIQLNQAPFDTALATEQASMTAASRSLEEAERHHERQSELFDEGSMALVEMDQVDLGLATARAKFATSNIAMARARYRKNLSSVYAPYRGIILDLSVSPGQYVNAEVTAPTLLRIAPLGVYAVVIDLSPVDAARVSIGQEVKVGLSGEELAGMIDSLRYNTDENNYQISVKFESSSDEVVAGLPAEISF